MSTVNFVSLYNKYRLSRFIGVDDWADRLSYFYSFVLLLTCTLLVTSKTYLLRPIACHMPTAPEGGNFKNYVESACWVLGTVPIRSNESMPQRVESWEELEKRRRINYYQWVPFMLALQSIMFYIPHLAWQTVSFSRLGTDLNQLVAKASEALVAKSESKRDECIQQVARALELLLFAHRDYRRGVLADFRRSLSRIVGFLFASKRLGTWTVFAYFCIKLTYLSNTVIQLYIMMIFLNYDHNMFLFAWKLVGNLLSETYWTESLYFPRLSYCTLRLRHLGARENVYAGVCALPVNMFNEKIYIFLFFWVMIVMLCTAISLLVWVFRMSTRRRRCTIIKKYLRLKQLPAPDQIRAFEHKSDNTRSSRKSLERAFRKSVDGFVNRFLCFDGVFLIHVMTSNVGDVITADLVELLWKAWITRYAGRPEWEQPSDVSDNEFEYVSPTVDEGRTLTESTMSGQRTNTGNSMEIRRRPHEAESARTRPSLPQSPATWTC